MLNCREATTLMLAGEDRRLRWSERAGLRMHLWICSGCTRFSQQMALMRQALQRWKSDPEAGAGEDAADKSA